MVDRPMWFLETPGCSVNVWVAILSQVESPSHVLWVVLFGPQLKEHPLRSKQVLNSLLMSPIHCGEVFWRPYD